MRSSLALRAEAELELRRRQRERPALRSIPTFREFVSRTTPRYQWYRHCEVIAETLERVVAGEIKRLMVFAPPRSGKSELVSRHFPAYYLTLFPDRFAAIASYSAELAYDLSRAARRNYTSSATLSSEAAAVKHWETGKGGGLWAAGVGGAATGKGASLLVCDDPLKNAEEASSQVIRDRHRDWWRSVWYTRLEPGAALILMMTRWHLDDLAGWLLKKEAGEEPERWTILSLPSIAEEKRPEFPASCTVLPDWRKPGEPLVPERYPIEKLNQIRARIGTYFFESLHQQRPSPPEGRRFRRSWFEVVDQAPPGAQRVRWWDMAATDGDGDWTVGDLVAWDGENVYIEDEVRGQWGPGERDRIIAQTADLDRQRHGLLVEVGGPQDPGAAGKTAALAFRRLLRGYRVTTATETGSKELRADVWRSLAEVGCVKLVRGAWNAGWLDEVTSFPGRTDDRVDATSNAVARLLDAPRSSLQIGRA